MPLVRKIIPALIVFSVARFACADVPSYTITDLGALPSLGGSQTFASAGNVSSGVVGFSTLSGNAVYHAFFFDGTMHDLGTGQDKSSASGVNANHDVVGNAVINGSSQAFYYDGTTHLLGTFGGTDSFGSAINSNKEIVGSYFLSDEDGPSHAFSYDGIMHDLGTLGGTRSGASSINDSGTIVGESQITGDSTSHAFMYNGSMHDLGTLGGKFSTAKDISSNGLIVGTSFLSGDTISHAFLYDGGIHDLGTIGNKFSNAVAVNDNGWVVGSLLGPSTPNSLFLYDGSTMYDLNTLLGSSSKGIYFNTVFDIDDTGEILAEGTDSTGINHIYKLNLSEVPLPASSWLFGSCITGLINLRNKTRFRAKLTARQTVPII